jgi:hypothetical protein
LSMGIDMGWNVFKEFRPGRTWRGL